MKDFKETLNMVNRCDNLAELCPELNEFIDAASKNDAMRVYRILNNQVTVDGIVYTWGNYALSVATLCGAKELIHALIDAHVLPTTIDLCVAVDRNDADIVELFYNAGAKVSNPYCNALENASKNNNIELVRFFVTRKLESPLDAYAAFGDAVRKNRYEMVKLIMDNVEIWPNVMELALTDAIRNNCADTFKLLIAKGAELSGKAIKYAYEVNAKSDNKPTEIVIIIENVIGKNF